MHDPADTELTRVQANVGGFMGKPCTVLSVYNPQTGVLKVSKIASFQQARVEGCLVVSTDSRSDCDVVLQTESMGDAVKAFIKMLNSDTGAGKCLLFAPGTERSNPKSAVDVDGYDDSGPVVRINPDVTCEHMAVMAACWAVQTQNAVGDCLSMFDQLHAFQSGQAMTI